MNIPYSRLLIIGAGQLGSRHLQGLSQMNKDVEIMVVDPNPNALEIAKNRYEEMRLNSHIRFINYYQNISRLDGEIDLAIIATTADVRRNVIEDLLNKIQVHYLILEKVVFQSIQDFESIMYFLNEKNVKTWVNCPRRMIPFFQDLREKGIRAESIRISVNGCTGGMASNTIHMLDLLAFLTGKKEITINETDFDKKIYKSKRSNFVELSGRLVAQTSRGDILDILDNREASIHLIMCFETDKQKIEINQLEGICKISKKDSVKQPIEQPFHMPMQTELTAKLVEQILETGNSYLTSLKESYLLHKPMLNVFNKHLSFMLKKKVTVCPIT